MVDTAALKEPPHVEAKGLLGSFPEIQEINFVEFLMKHWKEHGDVFSFRLGPQKAYIAVHPDDVKKALLNSDGNWVRGQGYDRLRTALGDSLITGDGESWRRRRRLMQPAFRPDAVASYSAIIVDVIRETSRRWDDLAETGEPVYIDDEMKRLAMAVIGRIMLNLRVEDEGMRAAGYFHEVLDYISTYSNHPMPLPMWLPTAKNNRYKHAVRELHSYMQRIIDNRLESGKDQQDFLNDILKLREGDDAVLTEDQLINELLTFFFAGHETTAVGLSWSWYLLEQHPDVEDKLFDSVDSIMGTRKTPTLDDLHKMAYPVQVFQEVLRLYPPIHIIARDPVVDVEVGGYRLPAGSLMFISPYLTDRHPDFWEEPDKFDPDRFDREAIKGQHPYSNLPFGHGEHICIGNNLALLEGQIALAMLARKFYLRLAEGHEVTMQPEATIRFKEGLLMTIHTR
ncbi:MAG: cytochrome P450 [Chloroflexi bacterium]|nr:cytochrome P450 [Chloroflexota bacterium]